MSKKKFENTVPKKITKYYRSRRFFIVGVHSESYILNNSLHRLDGPAETMYYKSGQIKYKQYWIYGQVHRTYGPAKLHYYENGQVYYEAYYLNNKWHRLDGPARIWYNEIGNIESKSYYVNGILLNKLEFYEKDKIFKYINDHPEFKNEVITLARHNKWLTEDQLLLLDNMILFKGI